MQTITTLKPKEGVELLAIVVDKDAYGFIIANKNKSKDTTGILTNTNNLDCSDFPSKGNYSEAIILPNNYYDWVILGTVEYNKEIEFDCDELVIKIGYENGFRYFEYVPKGYMVVSALLSRYPFKTSKESTLSLIEANNINLEQLDRENRKLVILKHN